MEATEVAAAFPLDAGPDGRPPPQDVFAFLPLRSYGLRFILQGDFVVPSSREAVDADSPWNQLLRESVRDAFGHAQISTPPQGCRLHFCGYPARPCPSSPLF